MEGQQQQQQPQVHPSTKGFMETAPQFGGAFSPLGGGYLSPMACAIRQRQQEHAAMENEPFLLKNWFINSKTPKLFEHFNGKAENYKTWASRVKDHLMSSNLSWGRLLEVVEGEKAPLTKVRLATIGGVDGVQLDLLKISQLLRAFLGNHCFANPVYERRSQLTAGEDHNGLQLRRARYHEH